jgi:hypothetical protein
MPCFSGAQLVSIEAKFTCVTLGSEAWAVHVHAPSCHSFFNTGPAAL